MHQRARQYGVGEETNPQNTMVVGQLLRVLHIESAITQKGVSNCRCVAGVKRGTSRESGRAVITEAAVRAPSLPPVVLAIPSEARQFVVRGASMSKLTPNLLGARPTHRFDPEEYVVGAHLVIS